MHQRFAVTGMTCAACAAHVERAVGQLDGVESTGVNLMLGVMQVSYDPRHVTEGEIIAAVESGGYGASLASKAEKTDLRRQQETQTQALRRRLVWSLVCLVPLFYLSMGHMLGLPLPPFAADSHLVHGLLQLGLCLPILLLNRAYFTVGFSRLWKRAPNMDTLVALGAAAALVYSLIELAMTASGRMEGMPDLYFESAGMICTLVTVGKFLEQRSRGKTTDAISSLLALAPESAVVKRGGEEMTIPAGEVTVGDIVVVRQGGRIPVDGVVTAGEASVDESAITGESLPVEKTPGDTLTSATVNRSGYLELRATRVGGDTTLSQIVRLMEEASSSKAPISRLADKISGIFVPVVMALALISALLWAFAGGMDVRFCLSIGIAVLVISCPCALGLATPVAIMVGTGKAAESGILIKSASALELMGRVDTVVLDKTGTVTAGKPAVTDLLCAADITEEDLLRIAGSAEQPSEHPLSLAVTAAADARGIPLCEVTGFAAGSGGVQAVLDGQTISAGNSAFMAAKGIDISAMEGAAQRLAEDGKTPLYFARDAALLGVIAVADTIKSDSGAAIDALQKSGHAVVLLTGDNEGTARAIARQVGVERVMAQVLPQDKAACVASLQRDGHLCAMVGDGINDAPALVQADVGLAIGAGTDIAIESADIVLMKSSLADIAAAADLSRGVLRNIRENLFWAFFYNAITIPVAAGVLYPAFGITLNPMIAAACMSLSSVCVVTNALRLRRWHRREPSVSETPNETTNEKEAAAMPQEETSMKRTISIEGMMCAHCVDHVTRALNAVGDTRAVVDLAAGTATVEGTASDDALRQAVEGAGYTVTAIH